MTIADGHITYADKTLVPEVPGVSQQVLTTALETLGEPLMIGSMDVLKIKVYYADGNYSQEIPIYNAADGKTPLKVKEGYAHTVNLVFREVVKSLLWLSEASTNGRPAKAATVW